MNRIILKAPFMRHYAGSVFDLNENLSWDKDNDYATPHFSDSEQTRQRGEKYEEMRCRETHYKAFRPC